MNLLSLEDQMNLKPHTHTHTHIHADTHTHTQCLSEQFDYKSSQVEAHSNGIPKPLDGCLLIHTISPHRQSKAMMHFFSWPQPFFAPKKSEPPKNWPLPNSSHNRDREHFRFFYLLSEMLIKSNRIRPTFRSSGSQPCWFYDTLTNAKCSSAP